MRAGVVTRTAEGEALAEFLASSAAAPTGLVLEGEAGIGKTTLWAGAMQSARDRGFIVLSARVGEAESVLAYAALADLLAGVDESVLGALPDLHRLAIDRVLLRAGGEGPATDQRVTAAAFVTVLDRLAAVAPVLVAVDDVQWLDPSSQVAILYAARRVKRPGGFLFTERCEPDAGSAARWFELNQPGAASRLRVPPMSLGALHTLLADALGQGLSRPTIVRIAEISGGNPFYALELARATHGKPLSADQSLPATLADAVRLRLDRVKGDTREVLLAAACVAAPTVELLASATDSTLEHIVDLLEEVETDGIIGLDGNRVRFSHPLLARGVYNDTTPARRRAMHRALAAIEGLPELKARHLALASTTADDTTLAVLDAAAETARARGAPAAAAELVDLAIRLGGDKPYRRIRGSEHHLRAGSTAEAVAILEPVLTDLEPGPLRLTAVLVRAVIHFYEDSFGQASELIAGSLDQAGGVPILTVQALLYLAYAEVSSGAFHAALTHADQAVGHAESAGVPALTSQVLAIHSFVGFLCGRGVDEAELQRALTLEEFGIENPIPLSASANYTLILAWTGRLDEAHARMTWLYERCIERGDEIEMLYVTVNFTVINIWRGGLAEAARMADEAIERAQQLGGAHTLVLAHTVRAAVRAYTGEVDAMRADVAVAHAAAERRGTGREMERTAEAEAFLELALGDSVAALAAVQPLIDRIDEVPGTEFFTASYMPYAIEALTALGRVDEAEPLVDALTANGERHDRAWMILAGARGRAMILAAQGDVEGAEGFTRAALAESDRLPMPFERARTLLLLGQLQRRRRQRRDAVASLTEALRIFDEVGITLWADRTREELGRITLPRSRELGELTASEQRVAELVATGMSTRDVAAELFISPKTVEHNLTRIYRKLGIGSRAELWQRMQPE